jgi:predicted Zn-dependent protease
MPTDAIRVRLAATGIALAAALGACATPTLEDEAEIGRKMNAQVYQDLVIVHDDVLNTYIDAIGQRLVRAAGPQPYDYTFTVVQDEAINAFATFGGQIFVHTGLITSTRNVSELAGVLAHEIGHVVHRHLAQNLKRQQELGMLRQAAVLGSAIGGVPNVGAVDLLSQLSTIGLINSFTREAEAEADVFAVDLLPRAGYDPHGMITMFEMLQVSGGKRPPKFFSDHPATEERIELTSKMIEDKHVAANLQQSDNGKLEIIQQRIRLLTQPPRRSSGR